VVSRIHLGADARHNQVVQASYSNTVLDHDQFRAVTLDDEDLMREILGALIDDTSRQMTLLRDSIAACDRVKTRHLAHYSKGACANVGAKAAAQILQSMEQNALQGNFAACDSSLQALSAQIDRLRDEAATL
jgi:HPt (histidine-containing phosphotransfer) domain-containing protein